MIACRPNFFLSLAKQSSETFAHTQLTIVIGEKAAAEPTNVASATIFNILVYKMGEKTHDTVMVYFETCHFFLMMTKK